MTLEQQTAKTSALFNVINHEKDVDTIYLYAKNSHGVQFQLLKNKCEM